MSLINEALRKARQAAAEHDDQRTAGRPPQAYPSRGPRRGAGPAVVILIAIVAGLAGAAGVWWIVGTGATELQPTEASAIRPPAESDPAGRSSDLTADGGPTIDEVLAPEEQPGVEGESPPPPQSATAVPETEKPDPETSPAPQTRRNAEAVVPPGGVRVFVMDAELGYASLSLGYIVFRPIRPFAEINGEDVYEGSEIGGFTVEKIEIDRVVLRDDRGPLELRVP